MTDDDRTIDADETTMAELRRLAQDAKAAADTPEPVDRTVQADDSTMDELRRFAEEARRQAPPPISESLPPPPLPKDHTVNADESAMATLRQFAKDAQDTSTVAAEQTIDLPAGALVSEQGSAPFFDVGSLPAVPPLTPEASAIADPPSDHTVARIGGGIDVAAPQSTIQPDPLAGAGWRPPPRMVMPTQPEKRAEIHHGPWKNIAIGLAAVVAVLAALVAFGQFSGGSDEETPDDGSVPTELEGSNESGGGLDG